jgi:hypothetical protein
LEGLIAGVCLEWSVVGGCWARGSMNGGECAWSYD